MRLLLSIGLLIYTVPLCNAQQNIEQQKQHYASKIEKYLDKEKTLGIHYLINDSGIFIYPSPQSKALLPELAVPWDKISELGEVLKCNNDDSLLVWLQKGDTLYKRSCNVKKEGYEVDANKKLKGIKIALDPGHIAGDLKTGMLEKKFLNFNYNNKKIELVEGILTLQTALILKKMLEEEGAEVLLTREKPNQTAFDITYKEWLEKHFKTSVETSFLNKEITEKEKTFLLTKATERDIFRIYFNNQDMKQRVKKINQFSPDITIVIHYNVDEKNTGWQKPTDKNFNMLFVAGSFLKDELNKPIDRLSFLRLLIGNDIENSVTLSEYLLTSFSDKLNVPAADMKDATYLAKHCLPAGIKGIYSRNLTLTRLTKGIVVYGETLYQDNYKECITLSNQDIEIYGIKTSSRVKQVAEAYYEGILNYTEKNRQ